MSAPQINQRSLRLIGFFEGIDTKHKIENCVNRYSTPKTFTEGLTYLYHRICNLIKSFFQKSDWQVAKKAMADQLPNQVLKIFPSGADKDMRGIMRNLLFEKLQKETQEKREKDVEAGRNKMAEKFLIEILAANKGLTQDEIIQQANSQQPKPKDGSLDQLVTIKEALANVADIRKAIAPHTKEFMDPEQIRAHFASKSPEEQGEWREVWYLLMGIDEETWKTLPTPS